MGVFGKKGVQWCTWLCVAAAVLLVLVSQEKTGKLQSAEKVTALSEGWYYMDGGGRVYVSLPAVIRQENGEVLTLYYDGLTKEDAGKVLTTRGAVYRLGIEADGQVLYQYEDTAFPRNAQMASKVNCTARLPQNFEGGTVSFIYHNIEDGLYQIPEICAGSGVAVLFYQWAKDAVTLMIVFVMAILGILTVCIAVYIKSMGVSEKRFVDIAAFLLLCVCWFLTDSSTAQMLGGSSPVIRYISFYAFMLLAVPMLHFVKDTKGMEKYPVIGWITGAFYVNVIIQSILNYLGVFAFVDMLFMTHILLVGGIAVLVTVMFREYKKSGSRELRTILESFTVVAGGGVLALILYWLLRISYYEVFFECGIIVMIILLIRSLVATMVQNLKFKTETIVYQRLANEDMLTGMKNRRAFDALLDEIRENKGFCQNAFLIFMDINGLKKINDDMGHHVGDEAVIAAARAVEKAYGKDGHCFRIGGDEFCAVLPDASGAAEQLSARLDAEIRQYNKTCSRYQLSVARGISSLRDEKGNIKTTSDWKREADLKMYADKGWVRKVRSEEK